MESNTPLQVKGHHVHQRHFDRLVMLSDGVFAIAMTLSAVELKPEVQPGATLAQLWLRPLLTYFMSFAIIGGVWMRHRRALAHLRHVDAAMTFMTLLLLSLVALMPVVIRQLLEGGGDWISAGMFVYSISLMAIYATLSAGWGYAAFVARVAPDVPRPLARAWLLQEVFVAVLFAALALYCAHLRVAAALLTLVGVLLRVASLRYFKRAKAAELAMTPIEGADPGQ